MSWARPRDQWKVNRAPFRKVVAYIPTESDMHYNKLEWTETLECGHVGNIYRFRKIEEIDGPPVDLRKARRRCRELLEDYRSIGPSGIFGAVMIEAVLKEADEASISGDLARMIAAFQKMKECE